MKTALFASILFLAGLAQALPAANICMTMTNRGYYNAANQCLQVGLSLDLPSNLYNICDTRASRGYYDSATSCISSARSHSFYDSNALAVCDIANSRGYYNAADSCLNNVADAVFDAQAVALCSTIANRGYYDSATSCLISISNRAYGPNLNICEAMINAGYYQNGITCLQQVSLGVLPRRVIPVLPVIPVIPVQPEPPRGNQPSVRAGLCYVSQTGEWLNGEQFFQKVSQWSRANRRCSVAKISMVPNSGRVYDWNGARVSKRDGGLSNREVEETLGLYGLRGCERFTCVEQ